MDRTFPSIMNTYTPPQRAAAPHCAIAIADTNIAMKSAAKSPLRRSAVPLLKAVLVIGLVIYVLTSIDWRDKLTSYDESSFIEYTKPVTVVGD